MISIVWMELSRRKVRDDWLGRRTQGKKKVQRRGPHTATRSHGRWLARGQHARTLRSSSLGARRRAARCHCTRLTAHTRRLPLLSFVSAVSRTVVSRGPSCRRSSCARVATGGGATRRNGVERQRRRRRRCGGRSRRSSLLCAGKHQSAGVRRRTKRGQPQRAAGAASADKCGARLPFV